ncbi:Lutropin-choriogonadotropic hormone receptor [Holothuria leucospilota]|uniref:Lutropin-choriogonadotropic hormone receptor n=1 Tax=Holothuria leucospilota TaxID=206669 RepID=A0A9Q1CFN3_HOLLE|nr:Lutropin-choriogonadotropic hormone receptor [Holothuria leucospilota]
MTSENYKMAKSRNITSETSLVTCPSTSDIPTTPETSTVSEDLEDDDAKMQEYRAILEHDAFGKFRENYEDIFNAHHGPYGDQPPPSYNRNFSILPDTFPVLTNSPQDKPVIDHGSFVQETLDPNATHTFFSDSCNRMVPKDYSKVTCSPKPDSFNPCSDVMGYSFLRVCVWFIALTALAGNGIVVLVLISQKRKMTVPKFLMCNLAFADFCMGVYLLLVAAVDVHTLGEYLNYTFGWQFGAGCKIAGFISLFSSELSVFTLTVITIERWYTIIYAIDLNKRIRLRLASRIMVGGWLFSIMVAMLPFVGIGNYGTTSMCLPFYVKENASETANVIYVTSILMINAFAFLTICACYVKMYVTVRNPNMVMKRKDSKVAKRMAILVFTDFACWAPIAIFGIAGAFGKYILTTDQSKILIVLFYPINSCANPFLYAIFTKSFRRDFFMLLAKHGMCEKRAMKYRPTVTSGPRSMSQINSSTMMRDNVKNVGYHRDSSASVITGVTDSRASVVSMPTGNGSPYHNLQKTGSQIPMSPLVVSSINKKADDSKDSADPEPSQEKLLAGNESLETVPEEVIGNTKENCRQIEHVDSDSEECLENSNLVNRPRDPYLNDKEVKRWRRADSGIHSIPSPSDDEDDNRTFVRNNGNERNYETVF